MKVVRTIVLFLALLMGFVLQSEIFQSELWSFDKAYYKTVQYDVSEKEEDAFFAELGKTADKYNVLVFSTYMQMDSNYEMTLYIYGDSDRIRGNLYETINLEEKTYHSLFSGITNIRFKPFGELSALEQTKDRFVSFMGEDENIQKVCREIASKYKISQPDFWESTEKDMIIIVWTLIAVLMIVMNCIEVIKRKKEIVIRISLGESASKIIIKHIFLDIAIYAFVYVIANTFVHHFISGNYEQKLALFIYVIGCFLSVLLYISYAFFDVRKAFCNVEDTGYVNYAIYVLKLAAFIITVFVISTNFNSINLDFNFDDTRMKQYRDYSYIFLRNLKAEDEGDLDFWDVLYKNEYTLLNPVICINILEDKEDYIFVNNNAKEWLQELGKMLNETMNDSDILVFLPDNKVDKQIKPQVIESLGMLMDNAHDLDIQYIQYSEKIRFSYMSSDESYGIARSTNPVIIFQNSKNTQINASFIESYAANEIMFGITDKELQGLENKYESRFSNYELVQTNVYNAYLYKKNFIIRLISFLSSLCVIIFILDVAVLISVNTLEYRKHAMEMALKKILGYGLLERNKKIYLASIIMDVFTTFVLCLAVFFLHLFDARLSMVVGIFITIVELTLITWNLIKIERENVQKILKGGCL